MKYQRVNISNKLCLCFIFFFLALMSASVTHAETYHFVATWGSSGTANGSFNSPVGVAVDSSDNVYVADTYNNRIQKFDSSGNFITIWGSSGTANGSFKYPYGVAVDSSDNVYVADSNNNRIQKFDSSGNFITTWGSSGTANGSFDFPVGVAVDSSDNVYVADSSNNRIQKFDSSGNFITTWGSYGEDNGSFINPYGVAVDSSDNVYVVDSSNNRIQKFDSSGNFITTWGSYETTNGSFDCPVGVAVDSSGNVYVADTNNNRIQKFDSSGNFITTWGSSGTANGSFNSPSGVAVDSSDNVYVADTGNCRIQKFLNPVIPVANFSSNVSSGYVPLTVQFTDSSSNASSWSWDFGDGSNSSEQNPVHIFSTAGNFSVNLTVSNANGADSTESIITVTEAYVLPVANFSSNVSSGYVPLSVQFNDSSENATAWNWDFGDGSYTPTWTEVNSSAGWSARCGHSAVSLSDGSIVVMGGIDSLGTGFNDTWRSTDGGATWTEINSSAGWPARFNFAAVSLPDGSIVVMGGYNGIGTYLNDTWRSDDGGSTWTEVNSSAGWSVRYCHSAVSLSDGSIVVMGGIDSLGTSLNDTWRSTDGGATWTEINSSAGWPARYNFAAVSLPDGSIVVMGGYNGTYFNDTWRSTDGGATWTEINSSADWSGRWGHSAVSLPDDSIVVMGGIDSLGTEFNDTWRSTDGGAHWTEINSSACWSARIYSSAVSLPDGNIVVMGGSDQNDDLLDDVWSFQLAGSMLQNPMHTYTTAGNFTVTLTAINGTHSNSTESTITVSAAPVAPVVVANFSCNVTNGTVPLSVQFNDSSENATDYNWDFGDGSNSSDQNPLHVFSTVGNFTVNLTAINGTYSDFKTINITVSAAPAASVVPVANFSSNVTSGTAPLTVQFNDSSSNATGWSWDFGDVSNSTVQNPVHVFSTAGNFSVNLTASNANGTDSFESTITVSAAPVAPVVVANFSCNVTNGTAPLSVQFTDLSENATSLEWDFDDDGVVDSNASAPVYTYSTAGTYIVNLTAINGTYSDFKTATITVSAASVLPVANFSSNVSSGSAPLTVQFNDSSENATSWNWNFGDGSNSTEQNPIHTYSTAGNYTVNLTVINGNVTDSKLSNITVSEEPVLPYHFVMKWGSSGSDNGQFNYPSSIAVDSSGNVYVADSSNNRIQKFDSSGNFLTTWGSSGSGSGQFNSPNGVAVDSSGNVYVADSSNNRIQKFDSNGTFLITWGSSGSSNGSFYYPSCVAVDSSDNVYVADTNNYRIQKFNSSGNFLTTWGSYGTSNGQFNSPRGIAVDSSGNVYVADTNNNRIQKFNSSAGFLIAWGSQGSSNGQFNYPYGVAVDSSGKVYVGDTFNHRIQKFNSSGGFLTTWGSAGYTDGKMEYPTGVVVDSSDYVYVADKNNNRIQKFSTLLFPVAYFSSNVSSGYVPLSVEFTDSSENVTEWNWDFGDGSNSTDQNPVHVFSSVGNFTVNLTVSNVNGTDSTQSTINVSTAPVLPVANFSSDVSSGYAPLTVEFTDLSANATSWLWDFGDGNTSATQNATYTYYVAGNYTVNLTVSNANGTDSFESTITVSAASVLPVSNFSSNVSSGSAPLTVQFYDSSENATSWNWFFGDEYWTEINSSAGWSARQSFSAVSLPDDSIIVMGGVGSSGIFNDVWRSTDGGVTWGVVNSSASWSARYSHRAVSLSDGSIVVVGGFDGTYLNDVWRSTDGGSTWTEVTSSAGWSGRYRPAVVSLSDGSIVVMGGNNGTYLNDVWRSTDGGSTWTEVTSSAGWSGRYDHSAVCLSDGSIVVMGGYTSSGCVNDVWRSTDGGATWSVVNSSAGWSARQWSAAVSLSDGSIVVMGGYDKTGNNLNDVWRSTDGGSTWTEVTSSAGWSARTDHSAVSLPNGSIVVMGGFDDTNYFNDVWSFQFFGSTLQNPTHTYTSAGNYTVTLTAINANGTDSTQSTITVTAVPVLPVANFSSNVSSGYAPLTVEFTDSSENATSWSWFFGDENYTQDWTQVTSSAGWSVRSDHAAVSLPDGSIVVMGGFNSGGSLNDVWRSTDGGSTWTKINSSAGWSARYRHAAVSLSDGSIVVMGGYESTIFNDVWRSTDGGATWTEVNSGADWSARYYHSAVSLPDGSIVIMGGYNGSTYFNDTWRSTDGGSTWTKINSSAGWSGRYGLTSVSLSDGSIVIMGGVSSSGYLNDVWRSTDGGETWTEVTSSAGWSGRYCHAAVSLPDDSIVVMGGRSGSGRVNDVWRSTDGGATWTKVNSSTVWSVRNRHAVVSLSDGSIVVMGGMGSSYFNDVWSFQFAGSTLQNPTHTYNTTGNYAVTLTAINANGTDSKLANITVAQHFYAYSINKTVTDVSGNSSSANVTKAGDVISYRINVTNDGTLNLTNVSVIDSLINLTGPFESLNSNSILEVGEYWIYSGNYTVTQIDLNNNGGGDGYINNTATVDCAELAAENDSVLVPIELNAVCSIKKLVLDVAGNGPEGNISSAGDVIQFRVNITNSGNVDLNNISVHDSLLNLTGPYGDTALFGLYHSSLVQSTSGGDGILSVGETWYYLGNYTVTQDDLNNNGGGDGFLNSTVTFDSSETEPIYESTVQYVDENGNESGDIGSGISIVYNPSCSFDKSVIEVVNGDDGAVDDAGDIICYSILLTNEGNVELTGVTVSDPLISLVGPVESLSTDGVLELGENWTYTGNYTVTEDDMDSEGDGDGDIDNTATMSCNELSSKTSSVEVELVLPESSSGSGHGSGTGSASVITTTDENEEVSESSNTKNTTQIQSEEDTEIQGNTGNNTVKPETTNEEDAGESSSDLGILSLAACLLIVCLVIAYMYLKEQEKQK